MSNSAARLLAKVAEAEAIVGLAGSLDTEWDEEYRITVPRLAAALRECVTAGQQLSDEIAAYREGWSDWQSVAAAWDAHQAALARADAAMGDTNGN